MKSMDMPKPIESSGLRPYTEHATVADMLRGDDVIPKGDYGPVTIDGEPARHIKVSGNSHSEVVPVEHPEHA